MPIRSDPVRQPVVLPENSELPQTSLPLLDDRAHTSERDSIVVFNGVKGDSESGHDHPSQKRMRRDNEEARQAKVAVTISDVPRSYKEVVGSKKSDRLNEEIEAEFDAHERNNTYTWPSACDPT